MTSLALLLENSAESYPDRTAIVLGDTRLTYAQVKSGNPAAAARLPAIGPAAGLSAFLAVIFAVIAFH